MRNLYLALEKRLLIARPLKGDWHLESHLVGLQVMCLAVDSSRPERVYCGTYRRGLWRSEDAGRTWGPVGDLPMLPRSAKSIQYGNITAVAVTETERAGDYGVVYAGTEPAAMFRSEDRGTSWQDLANFRELPSSSSWSFPPKPETSHVRCITTNPNVPGRVFCAVEAGALVQTLDGGATWKDRVEGGPYDTHTLVMHPQEPDRFYVAAGDGFAHPNRGYQESLDGGKTWSYPDEGLCQHYLVSVAVDAGNPETIVVSAAANPQLAHDRLNGEATLYRKTRNQPWKEITNGLPKAKGSMTAVITAAESGSFYLLSNHGCYYSSDAGLYWERLPLAWSEDLGRQHPQAIAVTDEK